MKNKTYLGHVIRKRFGQHFLHDIYVIKSIINIIKPQRDQFMVEIGPGLGALTQPILKYVTSLTVIEIDLDLVTRLANNPSMNKIQILKHDAMTIDFTALSNRVKQPIRVFGNLPYNISTSLILHLLKYTDVITDMHFMLQKEVVNRLIASPNSKEYGRLSIIFQYFCKIFSMLEIHPNAFNPVPKVNSTLVKIIPYTNIDRPYLVDDLNKLSMLTNLMFSKRRKIIRNSLANWFDHNQLINCGIDDTLRAENLSVKQYCDLANLLSKLPNL